MISGVWTKQEHDKACQRQTYEWEIHLKVVSFFFFFKAKSGDVSRPQNIPVVAYFQTKSCATWLSAFLVPHPFRFRTAGNSLF